MKKGKIEDLTIGPITNSQSREKYKIYKSPKTLPNKFIIERKVLTKTYSPLSNLINYKEDNKYFVSKTRRVGKYNPNHKVALKQLIIDTRSELVQTQKNKDSNKKSEYFELKNKKYISNNKSRKIYPQKIIRLKEYSTDYSAPKHSVKNIKLYNFDFVNFDFDNPHGMHKSLYTMLYMKKNQFMEDYYKYKEKEKKWNYFPKPRQKQFIMDRTPMANFFSRKRDIKTYISPQNIPLPYISILENEYLVSEKLRFQYMMQQLSKLKLCVEKNPKKEYDIIKEFLLNNKLFEVENFKVDKLKNFLHFIKGEFLLDPTKNFKENILDILNGNQIEKPHLSNEFKEEKNTFEDELILHLDIDNNSIKNPKDDNIIVKKLKYFPKSAILNQIENNTISTPKKIENKNKPKIEIETNLSHIYERKLTKTEQIERLLTKKYHEVEKFHYSPNLTEKEKERIKNFKCLPLNLRRQKEICNSNIENLNLDEKPELVIDLVEKKFREEEKENSDIRAKTVSNWKKALKNENDKLYCEKKNNSDYEELKKRNMLTEYICLMKAKNKFEIKKLFEKYKI